MKTKQQTMTSTSSQLEARSSDSYSSQEATTGMATVKFTILLQPPPGPKISPIFPTTNKKINNTNNDDTDDDDDDDSDHVANPPIFNDALSVRRTVFVDEQGHFVGNLTPGTRLAFPLAPGKHTFFHWSSTLDQVRVEQLPPGYIAVAWAISDRTS